jgi:RND family efflux transporter MFP subunit
MWRMLSAGLLLAAIPAGAATNAVTVAAESQTLTNEFEAYAQVEPVAVLPLVAAQAGIVTGLDVVPGALVQARQKLGELTGPEIEAAQAQAKAAVSGAQARLAAANQALAVERQQLPSHLSTQQQVYRAESAAAEATGALATAQAQWTSVRRTTALFAPDAGTVLALNAANGQRVAAGQTILTLQPTGQLWLRAAFYGSDVRSVRVGLTGTFSPAGGGEAIPVKVVTVFGAMAPDGGQSVGMVGAASTPNWRNGEFGTVLLNGKTQSLVAVPTLALVLDKGQWWVLIHTSKGEQPRRVVPGPARGWKTFIQSGLKPGAQVVVENAYLEFHRRLSKSYRAPD